MDGRVTPPKRVTSPTWGPPPPCKQALNWSRVSVMTRGLEWFLIDCRKLATTELEDELNMCRRCKASKKRSI